MSDPRVSADEARALLQKASRLEKKTADAVDYRGQALIEGSAAVAMFIYMATFLFLTEARAIADTPPSDYIPILIIPILVFAQLVQGARDALRVATSPIRVGSNVASVVAICSVLGIFALSMVLSVLGVISMSSLGMKLLIAFGTATPSGIAAVTSAWKGRKQMQVRVHRPPLTSTSRTMTTLVGIHFGATGLSAGFSWFPVAMLALIAALVATLLVTLLGRSSPWALSNVGAEWQRPQWLAFGASFTLLLALVIALAFGVGPTPLISTIGGVLVAAPLLLSAFAYRREAR